ncbi:hypothetical protein AWB70_06920 [Caballeronia cordobensis]|uniref:Polysaccharide pyruvyl transferase domain-containing protein n=1 Tax=Caballeronia cordobensis TaxID=1353886 RepID=A0A158JKF1_CABCO|nr:hypothetical protein [Caballeronia cordobensis]SAL69356.1 hypothetical protein AWB70_06920 [Caballeronia cordobensis]
MQSFCCYCDEASSSALDSLDEKIFLLGSDFGYPNFGDIAQLLNSIALHRRLGRYKIVLVMSTDAIGDPEFPEFMRRTYDADAIVFVSPVARDFEDSGLSLQRIRTMRNISALHLYGGGFLNDKWGEYYLPIIEYLLATIQPALYFASGLQITRPFESRVLEHLGKYPAALFGVRDELSYQWMTEAGYEPSFSFDDATEELQKLTANLPLRRGNGLLMHMNISGYTGNATNPAGIPRELAILASSAAARSGTTILQAYGDRRLDVFDAREAIKELERTFPFADYRVLELAQLAFGRWPTLAAPVEGAIGYSSSYHVALWLQLAGIPCWLRGSNLFYQQKRDALQVEQDFDAFMQDPHLANHSSNLERRGAWLAKVEDLVQRAPSLARTIDVSYPNEAAPVPWRFKGNGMRQWAEQSKYVNQKIATLDAQVAELHLLLGSEREKSGALNAHIGQLNTANRAELQRTQDVIAELTAANQAELQRTQDAIAVNQALNAQVAELSQQVAATETQCNAATAQNRQLLNSRTWRMTKPLRFGASVLRGDWASARARLRRMLDKS